MEQGLVFVAGLLVGMLVMRLWRARRGRGENAWMPLAQNRKQHEEKERRKRRIMALLHEAKAVSNTDVQTLLGISDATATNYLDELEKEGAIIQVGRTGKGVMYRLKNG